MGRERQYRETAVWVLPSFLLAGLIAWPFSFLMGPWAFLVGLPGAAVVLLLLDRFGFNADLAGLALMMLLMEVGVLVALLVKLAQAQAGAVGWWLLVLEAIALVAALRWRVRARRRRRRRGKELAWEDLTITEVRKVMTIGRAAVDRAGKLTAGQPRFDRTAALRDLRGRMRRRPELAPLVARAISERKRVYGWVPGGEPRTLTLAVELINEATPAGAPPGGGAPPGDGAPPGRRRDTEDWRTGARRQPGPGSRHYRARRP